MIDYVKSYLIQAPKYLVMLLKVGVVLPMLMRSNSELFQSVIGIFFIYALQRALIIAPYQIVANELLYSRIQSVRIGKIPASISLALLALFLSVFHQYTFLLIVFTCIDILYVYTVYLSFKMKEKSGKWFLSFIPNNFDYIIELVGLCLLFWTASVTLFLVVLIVGRIILVFSFYKSVESFYDFPWSRTSLNIQDVPLNLRFSNIASYTLSSFLPRAAIDGVLLLTVILDLSIENDFYMNRFYLNIMSTVITAILAPTLLRNSFAKGNERIISYFRALLYALVLLIVLGLLLKISVIMLLLSCGLAIGMNQSLFSYLKRLGKREDGFVFFAVFSILLSLAGLYFGNALNMTLTIWLLSLILGNLVIFLRYWAWL